jgi:hypothetical protein
MLPGEEWDIFWLKPFTSGFWQSARESCSELLGKEKDCLPVSGRACYLNVTVLISSILSMKLPKPASP